MHGAIAEFKHKTMALKLKMQNLILFCNTKYHPKLNISIFKP